MEITYRGPGTGLRLDGKDGTALDVGGNHGRNAPMTIYVQEEQGVAGLRPGKGATIALDPHEVVLLIEQCAHYLARHHGVLERER